MTDTHTPIDPATLDRAALLNRFMRPAPVQPAKYRNFLSDRYISTYEVADVLGIAQPTVTWRLNNGKLPVSTEKIGACRRIVRASFDAWLAQQAEAIAA